MNEAKLRGINLRKLKTENFTSAAHRKAMAKHQIELDAYWNPRRKAKQYGKVSWLAVLDASNGWRNRGNTPE